jgi:S-layer family protein
MSSQSRRSTSVVTIAVIGLTTFGWSAPAPAQAAGDQPTVTWSGPHAIGGQAYDVLRDGDRWIVAGTDEPSGISQPRAWTSSDGEAWNASSIEARDEPAVDGYRLWSTARLDETLYNLGIKVGNADERNIRGWQSSDDGDTWEVVESTDGIYADGFISLEAEAGSTTLVAEESHFTSHTNQLWAYTEADGWTETTPASPHPDGSGIEVNDILHADGTFVAVGTLGTPAGEGHWEGPVSAASWISTDGLTWTPSAANPLLRDHSFNAVAPRPGGGYVAIGHDGAVNLGGDNGTPQAWTSADGLTWTEVDAPRGDPGAKGTHLVAIDGGLLAVLAEPKWVGTQAWTSTDGTSWNFVGRFAHQPVDADSSGDEVVIVTTNPHPVTGPESFSHRGTVGPLGPEQPPTFTDIGDSPFREDIEWIAAEGITRGCSATRFCPDAPVLREQMATFLYRAFGFDITDDDFFTDDEHTIHEGAINRIAAAEVTIGCATARFCPTRSVSRAEMASFLVRTLDLPPASRDWFTDDEGSVHEDDINRLRDSGITLGCGGTRFCPSVAVPREQMAAFLHRALD